MTTLAASHSAAEGAANEALFRRVMASFVTGVTVITTQVRGEIRGMTANAFMSGSLEPPLCVISVGKKARMHAFLLEAGHFGVNTLARGQEALIGHFAGRPVEGHRSEIRICRRHTRIRPRHLDHRRQGHGAARLRRSFAVCRPYLRIAPRRWAFADRSARRQACIAHAARKNHLADTRFLVSAAPRQGRLAGFISALHSSNMGFSQWSYLQRSLTAYCLGIG